MTDTVLTLKTAMARALNKPFVIVVERGEGIEADRLEFNRGLGVTAVDAIGKMRDIQAAVSGDGPRSMDQMALALSRMKVLVEFLTASAANRRTVDVLEERSNSGEYDLMLMIELQQAVVVEAAGRPTGGSAGLPSSSQTSGTTSTGNWPVPTE